jgi:hypothetical protein
MLLSLCVLGAFACAISVPDSLPRAEPAKLAKKDESSSRLLLVRLSVQFVAALDDSSGRNP